MIEGSTHMVLCYVDDSATTHVNPKVLKDFYAYCGTFHSGCESGRRWISFRTT
jgi:hypothetical protein